MDCKATKWKRLWAVALACAGAASAALSDTVIPMFGGRLVAEGANVKVETQVASANWWFHGGYGGEAPDADGVYRFKLKPDDGQPIVDATLKLKGIDGGVHADYTFAPAADAVLNALCVKSTYDYADWRAVSVDGKDMPFPKDRKTVGFFGGEAKEIALTSVEGRRVAFRFAKPTQVSIQSNRAWESESFTVGIPVPGRSPYKGGVELPISFDLVGVGDFNPEAGRPVVVADLPGWVPIASTPWVKEGSALDFTSVRQTEAPAGKYGRVVAKGGHFEFENLPGVPQRFYGSNVCGTGNIPPEHTIDRIVQSMVRTGYNAIRFHHHDGRLVDKDDPAALKPDEEALRRFDALVASCVKHGLYLTTDIFVSRAPTWRSVGIDRDGKMGMWDFKHLVVVHEGVWENYKAFARLFLGHVNPFTGRTLAEEPALVGISLVNENPLDAALPSVYAKLPGWKEVWEKWLAEKKAADPAVYGDIPSAFPGGYLENRHGAAFLVFLQDVETRFAARVRAFLRDELKCKAPLTNMNCGGLNSSQLVRHDAYDYTDTHFYVDHPRFLGPAWSIPSYSASVNTFKLPTAGAQPCAGLRFFDRPFTITEFNFCGPSPIRSYGGMLTGAEGALQDWSGLWRFAWTHSDWYGFIKPEISAVASFDVVNDPIQRVAERAGIALFLRGDAAPLTNAWRVGYSRNWLKTLDPALAQNVHRKDTARVGWSAKYGMDLDGTTPGEMPPLPAPGRQVSVDREKGVFRVDTPRTSGGYIEEGLLDAGALRARVSGSPATVYATSLSDAPIRSAARILVAHLTDVQRAHTKFADADMKILLSWGDTPQMLMRPGKAEISLAVSHPETYAVWSLGLDGARRAKVPCRVEEGRLAFLADVSADPKSATCVYEVVQERDWVGEAPKRFKSGASAPSLSVLGPKSELVKGDLARFERVWTRLEKGEPVRIAVVGGSITRGAGASKPENRYGERFAAGWRRAFPWARIDFVNAGVGATGSDIGAFRLQRDVLSKKPDVVVVEFSVNDGRGDRWAASYEGVLRQLLKAPGGIAVIALGMVGQDGTSVQECHAPVAAHYGVPYVSYRDALYPYVKAGLVKWSDLSPDTIHPNDDGHAFAAALLNRCLANAYAAFKASGRAPAAVPPLPEPMYGTDFDQGAFVEMKDVKLLENNGFFPLRDWCWGEGLACTNAGGRLRFEVEGATVALLYRVGKEPYNWGKFSVRLDGKEVATAIDGYRDQWWWHTPSLFLCANRPGRHVVEVETLAEKNGKSAGYGCQLTGVLVSGQAKDGSKDEE